MNRFDLIEWRKSRKMTQQGLADAIGVSRRTINAWENGADIPDDVSVKLLKLDPAPSKAPLVPKWVTPKTAPHLYNRVDRDNWCWRPEHPIMLLGHAIRDIEGKTPWGVLASDAYQAALARYMSSKNARTDALDDEAWQKTQTGG